MNNRFYDEIVFGLTQEVAENKMREIVFDTPHIYERVLSVDKQWIKTNIRTLHCFRYDTIVIGKRCKIAHVDKNIPIWALHENIMPTTQAYEGGQIKYY